MTAALGAAVQTDELQPRLFSPDDSGQPGSQCKVLQNFRLPPGCVRFITNPLEARFASQSFWISAAWAGGSMNMVIPVIGSHVPAAFRWLIPTSG